MKKCISIAVLIFLCSARVLAQLSAIHYQIEKEHQYRLQGFTPGASVEFYSRNNGGKLLLTQTADEQGTLFFPAEKNFQPAFVLDADNQQTAIQGSKKVYFVEEKEFALTDLQLSFTSGQVVLEYTTSVRQPGIYMLEVLRSVDGVSFSPVHTVLLTNEKEQKNTFAEYADPSGMVLYQFKVNNPSGNFAAYSRILSVAVNEIVVYPNPCTDKLYATFAGLYDCYVLRNSLGQEIRKGQNIPNSGISMAELVPGIYTLELSSGMVKKAAMLFIKQ